MASFISPLPLPLSLPSTRPLRHPTHRPRLSLPPPKPSPCTPPSSSAPTLSQPSTRVIIEYCTGCRWGLRASWLATELLVTFSDGSLGEVALRPSAVAGTFRVWAVGGGGDAVRLWCRGEDGGFPELKVVKRMVRDTLGIEKALGHSEEGGKEKVG